VACGLRVRAHHNRKDKDARATRATAATTDPPRHPAFEYRYRESQTK